eukprot:jgi/Mesvir1/27548/Mv07302-RA.1
MPSAKTPNLDKLAFEGMRLTNWYAGSSMCSPSRAAMLTGRYHIRSRTYPMVYWCDAAKGLPADETTVAEMLQGVGYDTAYVGKWHLGTLPEYMPTAHGFDQYYGVPYSIDMGALACCPSAFDSSCPFIPLVNGSQVVEQPVDHENLAAHYAAYVSEFIRKRRRGVAPRATSMGDATQKNEPGVAPVASTLGCAPGHAAQTGGASQTGGAAQMASQGAPSVGFAFKPAAGPVASMQDAVRLGMPEAVGAASIGDAVRRAVPGGMPKAAATTTTAANAGNAAAETTPAGTTITSVAPKTAQGAEGYYLGRDKIRHSGHYEEQNKQPQGNPVIVPPGHGSSRDNNSPSDNIVAHENSHSPDNNASADNNNLLSHNNNFPPSGSSSLPDHDPGRRPFFLVMAFNHVHISVAKVQQYSSSAFKGRSRRGRFGDALMEMDWAVGQIMAALDEDPGTSRNTLVLFTSDNGPWTVPWVGTDGGSMGPFFGCFNCRTMGTCDSGKCSNWEGGWRVPAIARWPGRIRPGSVSGAMVGTTDLLPTAAALAGAALPEGAPLDGIDISHVLLRGAEEEEAEEGDGGGHYSGQCGCHGDGDRDRGGGLQFPGEGYSGHAGSDPSMPIGDDLRDLGGEGAVLVKNGGESITGESSTSTVQPVIPAMSEEGSRTQTGDGGEPGSSTVASINIHTYGSKANDSNDPRDELSAPDDGAGLVVSPRADHGQVLWQGIQTSQPTSQPPGGSFSTRVARDGGHAFFFYWRIRDPIDVGAVRFGPWKAHFITQPGRIGSPITYHDPPLLFNVEYDPSERFDLDVKKHASIIKIIEEALASHKAEIAKDMGPMPLTGGLTLAHCPDAIICKYPAEERQRCFWPGDLDVTAEVMARPPLATPLGDDPGLGGRVPSFYDV